MLGERIGGGCSRDTYEIIGDPGRVMKVPKHLFYSIYDDQSFVELMLSATLKIENPPFAFCEMHELGVLMDRVDFRDDHYLIYECELLSDAHEYFGLCYPYAKDIYLCDYFQGGMRNGKLLMADYGHCGNEILDAFTGIRFYEWVQMHRDKATEIAKFLGYDRL